MTSEAQTIHQLSLRDYLDTNDDFLNVKQTKDQTAFETVDYFGANSTTLRCYFNLDYTSNPEKTTIKLLRYRVKFPSSNRCFVTDIEANNTNAMFGPTEITNVDELNEALRNIKWFIQRLHELTVGVYEYDASDYLDGRMYKRVWNDKPPFVRLSCPLLGEFNYVNASDIDQGWLPNVNVVDKYRVSSINGLAYSPNDHRVRDTVNYINHPVDPIWLFEREYAYLALEADMKGEPLPFTMSFTRRESKELGISVTVTLKALDGSLERTNVFSFPNATDVDADKLINFVKIFRDSLPRYRFVKYATLGLDEVSIAVKSDGVETIGDISLTTVTYIPDEEVMSCRFKHGEKWFRLEIKRRKVSDKVDVVLYETNILGEVINLHGDVPLSKDEYQLIGIRGYELLRAHLS